MLYNSPLTPAQRRSSLSTENDTVSLTGRAAREASCSSLMHCSLIRNVVSQTRSVMCQMPFRVMRAWLGISSIDYCNRISTGLITIIPFIFIDCRSTHLFIYLFIFKCEPGWGYFFCVLSGWEIHRRLVFTEGAAFILHNDWFLVKRACLMCMAAPPTASQRQEPPVERSVRPYLAPQHTAHWSEAFDPERDGCEKTLGRRRDLPERLRPQARADDVSRSHLHARWQSLNLIWTVDTYLHSASNLGLNIMALPQAVLSQT